MFRLGLVDTLVTHANKEGFGLTPLSGDRRGYMPPLLKKPGRCDVSVSADQSAKLNPQEPRRLPVLEMRTLKSHSTLSSHSKGQIICRK